MLRTKQFFHKILYQLYFFFFLIIGLYIFLVGNQGEENFMLVFGLFNLSVFTSLKTGTSTKQNPLLIQY